MEMMVEVCGGGVWKECVGEVVEIFVCILDNTLSL